MDQIEILALKRKDFLIHNYMQWNDSLKHALLNEHIIGPDQTNIIEKRHENVQKSRALLDRLKFKGRSGDLTKLAKIMSETSSSFIPEWHNRWLADEIREELADQRCELTVDENIIHEAGTIVHRQFGHGKRLSEHEKKALVLILCVETQKTLNVWKQEIERTERDTEYETELIEFKDEAIREVAVELQEYIDKNKGRLPERKVKLDLGMSQHLRGDTNRDDSRVQELPLETMKEGIDVLSKMLGASLLATEVLDKERSKVLKRVGIDEKAGGHRIKLDEELKLAIERTAAELANADETIFKKEEQYKELEEELKKAKEDLARQISNKEKNISILLNEVHRAKEKAIEYNMEASEFKRKLRHAKGELHDWLERFEMIERGDRINYIYKRDEHILAKVKAKHRSKTAPDEDINDHVKEFEDFEKDFLSKKSFLPNVVGPGGKKLQHSMSHSRMLGNKAPGTPRSRVTTPIRGPLNGRNSRLINSSTGSLISGKMSSQRKSYAPLGTSLRENIIEGYQTKKSNRHHRTKQWVQKGFVDSQESVEDGEEDDRSRSRFSKKED